MRTGRSIVVTSIAGPTEAMRELALGAGRGNLSFLCIGDKKSPESFQLEGCRFVDLLEQRTLDLELALHAPTCHYSRKNIGYLLAVREGAAEILETDDDNRPMERFWSARSVRVKGRGLDESGWVNAYRYFTDERIWPRGLGLEAIRQPKVDTYPLEGFCPVQQGLANGDADVDALYRLTDGTLLEFREDEPIILGPYQWCPFNSQNTWWHCSAFPLMYLPSYCSFRMTDIWRSFVCQVCLWPNALGVSFHAPTVHHDRNAHDLMRDFEDELPGYLHNTRVVRTLGALSLEPGADRLFDNQARCYEALIDMGLVDKKELTLLAAWRSDLLAAGWPPAGTG